MRKFTEPTQCPNLPALKKAPLRNGAASSNAGQANLLTTTASRSTSRDRPIKIHKDSTSHTSTTSQNHVASQSRGVANKPLSSAGQWHNSVGGTRGPAEKDVHASSKSKEDEAPGRAAGQQVTQGEAADPDMKTFLTVEIKDGRPGSSSTSTSRGNIVPITNNLTPRITTNALGQRAGTITQHVCQRINPVVSSVCLCTWCRGMFTILTYESMLNMLHRALFHGVQIKIKKNASLLAEIYLVSRCGIPDSVGVYEHRNLKQVGWWQRFLREKPLHEWLWNGMVTLKLVCCGSPG